MPRIAALLLARRRAFGMRKAANVLVALSLVLWPLRVCAAAAADVPAESWFSIYAGSTRIGVSHVWTQPDVHDGRTAVLTNSDTTTSLVAFGTTVEQKVTGRMWSDPMTGIPVYETLAIKSGGSSTDVAARYYTDRIDATLTSGGSVTHKTIPIPSGVSLSSSDIEHGVLSEQPLARGQVFSETSFDPLAMRIETYTVTVTDVGKSLNDPVLGQLKDLAVCRADGPSGTLTIYLDHQGQPLRIDLQAGISMCRERSEPHDAAGIGNGYSPPTDFAVATSVNQTGALIDKPRDCHYLKVQLTTPDNQSRTVEVHTVFAGTMFDTTDSVRSDANMAPYLADAPYLSLDDPDLKGRAAALGGTTTNLYDLVVRTHDWVYQNMQSTATLGLPRSAASVLQDRRGVCRDYAILYTALARAEGIPTRVCAGLVAFGDRFYYHAWAESYVGGSAGWLPVDPTLETRTVDATHVVITRGGPDAIFDVAPQIGRLRARILEASY
ncbi:MAG: transglutaminase-like domain-containing protein [Capsulimonadaceae bacterium]|nr:transglutaminase-like domain-containing protein [Capsulimonadaceae bacterium]